MPTQRPYVFTVLKPFTATVNGRINQYHAGHLYTVRVGKPWDDLDRLVQGEWLADRKVRLGR